MKKIRLVILVLILGSIGTSSYGQDTDDAANIGHYLQYLEELAEKISDLKNNADFISQAKEVYDAIKIFETVVCTFEDLEFYITKSKKIGYDNCFIDFEIEVNMLQLSSAGKLLSSLLLTFDKDQASNKTSKLVQAVEAYKKAHKDIFQIKEDLKAIIRFQEANEYELNRHLEWINDAYTISVY